MKDSKPTIASVLRDLLYRGAEGTQEEIAKRLKKQLHATPSQASISRALKHLRAEKHRLSDGRIVWRLPAERQTVEKPSRSLVQAVVHNGFLIVIHTDPGAAGQVAYLLDRTKPEGILGTIAGDDTVFVAPRLGADLVKTRRAILALF